MRGPHSTCWESDRHAQEVALAAVYTVFALVVEPLADRVGVAACHPRAVVGCVVVSGSS